MLYFAKNDFAGTRIGDLAKHIGIGQDTLYVYVKSREELFSEIFALANSSKDIEDLKILMQDDVYAAKIALNTQLMLEKKDFVSVEATYWSELYQMTEKIIKQE